MADEEKIRLNKYVAKGGKCSRRKADELIAQGKVKVNGKTVTEMGIKVHSKDKVYLSGKRIYSESLIYILLNKPKDCITTTKDPEGRKTVLDYVDHPGEERLFPVGRLDRNTTGVLLVTNDGELTQKLTHPKFEVKKIYKATLQNPISKEDIEQLTRGVELEDGIAKVDQLSVQSKGEKKVVGVEIHSGKNRIIRRLFEAVGNHVEQLDRVVFAGIDKEGLQRGKWRYLKPYEIKNLKK